jgi:hypothetical protein
MSLVYHRTVDYRVLAVGVEVGGHPVESILYHMERADQVAHEVADKYQCVVKVFQTSEHLLKTVRPSEESKAKKARRAKEESNCNISQS